MFVFLGCGFHGRVLLQVDGPGWYRPLRGPLGREQSASKRGGRGGHRCSLPKGASGRPPGLPLVLRRRLGPGACFPACPLPPMRGPTAPQAQWAPSPRASDRPDGAAPVPCAPGRLPWVRPLPHFLCQNEPSCWPSRPPGSPPGASGPPCSQHRSYGVGGGAVPVQGSVTVVPRPPRRCRPVTKGGLQGRGTVPRSQPPLRRRFSYAPQRPQLGTPKASSQLRVRAGVVLSPCCPRGPKGRVSTPQAGAKPGERVARASPRRVACLPAGEPPRPGRHGR